MEQPTNKIQIQIKLSRYKQQQTKNNKNLGAIQVCLIIKKF